MKGVFQLVVMLFALLAPSVLHAEPDSTHRKIGFKVLFNFDARRTFVDNSSVRFNGFRVGAQRGKDLVMIGFYGLGDPYVQPAVDLGELGVREFHTRFNYTALTYERLLIDVERWQLGIPIAVGLGNYKTSYKDDNGKEVAYGSNELVPLEATLQVDYNLFWFVFIGVGGGYRYVLAADPGATRTLSDWTFYGKLGLRLGEVVKRVQRGIRKGKHGNGS